MTKVETTDAGNNELVSPQELATLFDGAAEAMMRSGQAQRLGSYVVSYENQAGIKQHPVKDRVTHARLVGFSRIAARPITTHEIHFPSRDRQAEISEAGTVIFETHTYDPQGARVDTTRVVSEQIDMASPDMRPFLEQISELSPIK